jgi:Leucine-rich repeat (LRR) protein
MNEEAIFLAALDTDPTQRAAFLDQACGGDLALQRGVETLLKLHARANDFLDVPAVEQLAPTDPGTANTAVDLSFVGPSSEPGSLGRLDQYEVLEVVGRGGMGVVLRARDTKLERIVAIKVLAQPFAASGMARQRFAREARAAAAVRDEHVVAIHAVRDDAPMPYLVMEYIGGCNLETVLRRSGPPEIKEVLRIGLQIARGLAAAHAQGLVHRDVKPANILLENGVQRVKLSDFGLARAADDARLTQSGVIAGTPLYMAPEQASGEAIDPRADLFSLGSVLYELCTGRPTFRAPTTVAVIRRVCDEAPRPIREVNPDIPESLCRVIERLHAKKPADRPASATEVADLMAGLLASLSEPGTERRGVSGGPRQAASAAALGARPGWRPWVWAAAAMVLLCVGLGLGEATGVTDVRGTVIRLFSPAGTLIVEVDDPGVSVTVDGGDVVITGTGAKEIRLKPGQYKVEASKDGKVVSQELVTVSREGRKVVRISAEPPPLTPGAATADSAWEKSVAPLSADEQVAAVVKRLKELNPRFDGRVEPTVRDEVVVGLAFNTNQVSDLSPVRALVRLEYLVCCGTAERHGSVGDLSPLRGLPLKTLCLLDNQVTDLSPLRGMPLKSLIFQRNNAIKDLTPLEGMPLEYLECAHTNVADLSPLKGMKLKHLSCDQTLVSDLSPLRGMALEALSVAHCGRVTDLAPLKGMSLKRLSWVGSGVSDLSQLKGMPLKEINGNIERERDGELLRSLTTLESINGKAVADFWKETDGKGPTTASAWEKSVAALPAEQQVEAVARRLKELNPRFEGRVEPIIRDGVVLGLAFNTDKVSDLAPLRALVRLESLNCGGSTNRQGMVADLSPLRGLPLKSLQFSDNHVSDLSPLRGMPLQTLEFTRNEAIKDLAPLQGMPLELLACQFTNVADLSPLKGMKLKRFSCDQTLVSDLSPLRGMALEALSVANCGHVTDLAPLKGMPLQFLWWAGSDVSDLSPLKGMPLKEIYCEVQRARDAEFLRSITSLETINGKAAADFWKEVDGK